MLNLNSCEQTLGAPDEFLAEVAMASVALRTADGYARPFLAELCPILEVPAQQELASLVALPALRTGGEL